MPRTKRAAAKKEKPAEETETSKKISRLIADALKKIDLNVQMQCRDIELAFKILVESLSTVTLQKTIGELKREQLQINREVTIQNDVLEVRSTRRSRNSSRTVASHLDDGYVTENSSQSSGDRRTRNLGSQSASRATRRSRSADASARKPPTTIAKPLGQRRRSRSVYKTPVYNRSALQNYPCITPKVAPHTPLTVLRQPRQGEMVVSMSGSPVMVPTYSNMQQSEKVSCNIMLQDGTMLSMQPKQLRQSQAYIPFSLMDSNVLTQLKTLQDNLQKVVKMGERAMTDSNGK